MKSGMKGIGVSFSGQDSNLMHTKKMFGTFRQRDSEVDRELFVKRFVKRTARSLVPFTPVW